MRAAPGLGCSCAAGGGQPASQPIDWSGLIGYQTGTGAVPLLIDADNRPIIGTTINIIVDQVPANSLIAGIVFGTGMFNPGIPLDALGMPGCSAYASLDLLATGVLPGAQFSMPLAIVMTPP